MSSITNPSGSSREPSPKLDQTSLGEHTKRSQGYVSPNVSKKLFVESWVVSQETASPQRELETEAEGSTSSSQPNAWIPNIVLTDTDEGCSRPLDGAAAASPDQDTMKEPQILATKANSVKQKPLLGPSKKPLVIVDQPILEEFEEEETLEAEAATEDATLSPSYRPQTKSYPSNLETTEVKLSKFAHVAIMAKKWKKRSGPTGGGASVAMTCTDTRQKRRPFVEVPRALKLEVLEDAYPIVQKTHQMYKSYLGPKHQLTVLAEKHLTRLNAQLGKNSS